MHLELYKIVENDKYTLYTIICQAATKEEVTLLMQRAVAFAANGRKYEMRRVKPVEQSEVSGLWQGHCRVLTEEENAP